jgi:hypothetical protein
MTEPITIRHRLLTICEDFKALTKFAMERDEWDLAARGVTAASVVRAIIDQAEDSDLNLDEPWNSVPSNPPTNRGTTD